eukprot:scaffold70507_cov62-Attheya_sp.AAC.2
MFMIEGNTLALAAAEVKTEGENKPSRRYYRNVFRKIRSARMVAKTTVRQPKFEGREYTKLLTRAYIYNCTDSRQLNMFIKTTKEIAKYARHTYR